MCMSFVNMCMCLLTWMLAHMYVEILLIFPCLYMCSIMYRIPGIVLRTTSLITLPHTLKQGLSLNSEFFFKLWLASQIALMSNIPISTSWALGLHTECHTHSAFAVNSWDPNSGPHICGASMVHTESSLQHPDFFVLLGMELLSWGMLGKFLPKS